ncbi:hypothetical protein ACJIZ3_010570 [Penstemon smallii]|uniref:Pentatricopeptide repeat-containing protein n=1 Tax=Penstemon smallii TaxID=265156 RepID=A0ABD3UKQ8_9LAMI
MDERTLFTWNTIIRGFSNSSDPRYAILLFVYMLESLSFEPERRTYPSVFKAYTQLGLAKDGGQVHGRVIKLGLEFDPFIRNSIIHMYVSCGFLDCGMKLFDEDKDSDIVAWNSIVLGHAKCGEVEESWRLFRKMPNKNDISWNSMMSGFVRNGKWIDALKLFDEMSRMDNIKASGFTVVSLLNACANLGAFEQGKWVHEYIKKNGIELNVIVVTAIIDMYCKCGSIELARKVFEGFPMKGLSCWNSMMLGLATNGFENEVFELFLELESSNLRPDSVSFVAVLTACSHSGQVEKARPYFTLMTEKYEIEPLIEHYGCMVDVLGRAGFIEEAVKIIRSMPMNPDAIIWGSLLTACNSHRNVDVAKWAAENLILLDPNDTSAHVLMSNVYAASGDFERATWERISMHKEKQPGCSLIEVNGEVHEFVAGGMWHYQM